MTALVLLSLLMGQTVTPPVVHDHPSAVYPAGQTMRAQVMLLVTVSAQGDVSRAEVAETGGAPFDAAAQDAVRHWTFAPASREGAPIASRVRIPFVFEPAPTGPPTSGGFPGSATATTPAPPDAGTGPPASATAAPDRPTVVPLAPTSAPAETTPETAPGAPEEVRVRGTQHKVDRGASDFQIELGSVAKNVNGSASDILKLAPGIFLANEGGAGHADQVFLRGFNAEQGQDIEFTVNGVPINERDNPDGHGYADTHFIIPELVKSLRVIEGPFDPHQGDFAVAGSADYELGVVERGVRVEGWLGSFDTKRLLAIIAPSGQREGTFLGAQYWTSNGFGVNRANDNFSAMGQYEGELGARGLWRLFATAYSTHYRTAGVVRLDDVQSGRIGFYGTEDPSQGGDAQRYSLSFDLESPTEHGVIRQQVFLTYRTLRIQEDFTGFLLDNPLLGQSDHPQRGDGILQSYTAMTAGARGSYRASARLFGQEQSLELGYYARYDHTTPSIDRVRFGTQIPYQTDMDLVTDVVNLAAYLDLDIRPLSWLTLRGGVRQEYFGYNVLNNCATAGNYVPGAALDQLCPSYDRAGVRAPGQRVSASGGILEPKVSILMQALSWLSFTGSYGVGAQSSPAQYITQDANAPFSTIQAGEVGALAKKHRGDWDLSGRVVGYYTHVDRDLIFDPTLGRLTASTGTTRRGFVAAGRAIGRFLDEMVSATYADATYDADHTLVPYVPNWVARSDTVLFGDIPHARLADHPISGTLGLTASYLGVRALPLGQFSQDTLQLDINGSLRWRFIQLGMRIVNLTNRQYALSQFYYASDFHSRPYATLAPAAAFTAAAPRTFYFTLAFLFDPEHL